MAEEGQRVRKLDRSRFIHQASTLAIPTLLLFVMMQFSPQAMSKAMDSIERVVASFSKGSSLVVLDGLSNAEAQSELSLIHI